MGEQQVAGDASRSVVCPEACGALARGGDARRHKPGVAEQLSLDERLGVVLDGAAGESALEDGCCLLEATDQPERTAGEQCGVRAVGWIDGGDRLREQRRGLRVDAGGQAGEAELELDGSAQRRRRGLVECALQI